RLLMLMPGVVVCRGCARDRVLRDRRVRDYARGDDDRVHRHYPHLLLNSPETPAPTVRRFRSWRNTAATADPPAAPHQECSFPAKPACPVRGGAPAVPIPQPPARGDAESAGRPPPFFLPVARSARPPPAARWPRAG